MQIHVHYFDGLTFEPMPAPTDPKTGTVLNRVKITDKKGSDLSLWLDEESARALQTALGKLYPGNPEDIALDKWASEHEGEFINQEAL